MAKKEVESYYRGTIPKLIDKYKLMIEECLTIVGQKIDGDLSDDKMHNVIKSKKMAAETAKWGAQEIDQLESELAMKPNEKKIIKATNYSEHLAQ